EALAVEVDLAGIRNKDARQTVQQRRPSRAARAHHGDDLTLLNRNARPAKRWGFAEGKHKVASLEDRASGDDRGAPVRRVHAATSSASTASRAAVRSIQRRSASRWKRPWSARRASTTPPFCLSSVSSRIRARCAARWTSRYSSAGRPSMRESTTFTKRLV